ncbi:MAG: hypothetical protein JJD92_11835 [Frankiaceae bacterium]|nr:hypothetical protein [Frankiaceae bacterium]
MSARLRPLLASAVIGVVAATGAVHAASAKPPVCNLVTDAVGDANGTFLQEGVAGAPSEDAVDIVSADLASKGKKLTTVLRVKKLAASSPTAPGGLHWKFFFSVAGTQIYTQAIAAAGAAPAFTFGTIDETTGTSTSLGAAEGVLDTAKNEVRITVSTGSLPESVKPGTKIDTFAPNAGRFIGNDAVLTFSDSTDLATSDRTYVAGAPSCVKVGK